MKRVIVICCVLMCFGGVEMAQAQSLKDILNSSKVKDVVNLVTGNVIKFSDLQGTWNYVEPACKMTSGDLLKEASGSLVTSALEKKMVNIYTKLGIVPGNFSYTFSSDSTFTNTIGKKVLKGTYSLDEKTRVLTLRYMLAKTITVKSVEVQLVFRFIIHQRWFGRTIDYRRSKLKRFIISDRFPVGSQFLSYIIILLHIYRFRT